MGLPNALKTPNGNVASDKELSSEKEPSIQEFSVALQQAALDLQWSILPASSGLSPAKQVERAEQLVSVAHAWAEMEKWELSNAALQRYISIDDDLQKTMESANLSEHLRERAAVSIWDSLLLRFRAAMHLNQELPAKSLILRIKEFPRKACLGERIKNACLLDTLESAVIHGRLLLEAGKPEWALQLLELAQEAHLSLSLILPELCEAEMKEDIETLHLQLLMMLAWTHTEIGDNPEQALIVVRNLEDQFKDRLKNSCVLHLLKHRALMKCENFHESLQELVKVLEDDRTSEDTTVALIGNAFLSCASSCNAGAEARLDISHVLDPVTEKYPAVVWRVIEHILKVLLSPRGTHNIDGSSQDAVIDMVLYLLKNYAKIETLASTENSICNRVYIASWNLGCKLAESCNHSDLRRALSFFQAVESFAQETFDGKDSIVTSNRDVYMAQALCHLSLNNSSGALYCLEEADKCSPRQLDSAFLRLKACLQIGDAASTRAAIQSLAEADETDADILRLACCEALDSDDREAAECALTALLKKAQDDETFLQGMPNEYELVILQNLIRVIVEYRMHPSQQDEIQLTTIQPRKDPSLNADKTSAEDDDDDDSLSGLNKLVYWYSYLMKRMKNPDGKSIFSLDGCDTRVSVAQIEWLAAVAWNAGVEAARCAKAWHAARLLGAAGTLYSVHPHPKAETIWNQRLLLVTAAGAVVDHHINSKGAVDDAQTKVKQPLNLELAQEYLEEANKANESLRRYPLDVGKSNTNHIDIYAMILQFQVQILRGDAAAARNTVEAAQRKPYIKAEHLITMATCCNIAHDLKEAIDADENGIICPEAAKMALRGALHYLTSQEDINCSIVASTSRALFDLADSDQERMDVISEAISLLASYPSTFPSDEARWLLATSWNRGAMHSKFKRRSDAIQWMEVALRAADHVDGFEKGSKNRVMLSTSHIE